MPQCQQQRINRALQGQTPHWTQCTVMTSSTIFGTWHHQGRKLHVSQPQLPRKRKLPRRYGDGLAGGDFLSTPKAHFKPANFEAIDLITNCPGAVQPARLSDLPITGDSLWSKPLNGKRTWMLFVRFTTTTELLHSQLQTFGIHSKRLRSQQYRFQSLIWNNTFCLSSLDKPIFFHKSDASSIYDVMGGVVLP